MNSSGSLTRSKPELHGLEDQPIRARLVRRIAPRPGRAQQGNGTLRPIL